MPGVKIIYSDGSIAADVRNPVTVAAALKGGARLADIGYQLIGDGVSVNPDDWIIYTNRFASTNHVSLRDYLALAPEQVPAQVIPAGYPADLPALVVPPIVVPPFDPQLYPPEPPPVVDYVPHLDLPVFEYPNELPPVMIDTPTDPPWIPVDTKTAALQRDYPELFPMLYAPQQTVTLDDTAPGGLVIGPQLPARVEVEGKGRLVYTPQELNDALNNGGTVTHVSTPTDLIQVDVTPSPAPSAFDSAWNDFLNRVAMLEANPNLYAEDLAAAIAYAKQFLATWPQAPAVVAEKIGDWGFAIDNGLVPSREGGSPAQLPGLVPAGIGGMLPWIGLGLGLLFIGSRRKS